MSTFKNKNVYSKYCVNLFRVCFTIYLWKRFLFVKITLCFSSRYIHVSVYAEKMSLIKLCYILFPEQICITYGFLNKIVLNSVSLTNLCYLVYILYYTMPRRPCCDNVWSFCGVNQTYFAMICVKSKVTFHLLWSLLAINVYFLQYNKNTASLFEVLH